MSQPTLLESLHKAHQGNYGIILSLLGCLDHGLRAKKLVDKVIDASASHNLCKSKVQFILMASSSRSGGEFTRGYSEPSLAVFTHEHG